MAEAVVVKVGASAACAVGKTVLGGLAKKIMTLLLDNKERDIVNQKAMDTINSELDQISQDLELLKGKDLKAACVALKAGLICATNGDQKEAVKKLTRAEDLAVSGFGTCTKSKDKLLATKVSVVALTYRKMLIEENESGSWYSLLEMVMDYLKMLILDPDFLGHIKTHCDQSYGNMLKKKLYEEKRYTRLLNTHEFVADVKQLIYDNTLHILPDIMVPTSKEDTSSVPFLRVLCPNTDWCNVCTNTAPQGERRCYRHLVPCYYSNYLPNSNYLALRDHETYLKKYVPCGVMKQWETKYLGNMSGYRSDTSEQVAVKQYLARDTSDRVVFGIIMLEQYGLDIEQGQNTFSFNVPPASLLCEETEFDMEHVTGILWYVKGNVEKVTLTTGDTEVPLQYVTRDAAGHRCYRASVSGREVRSETVQLSVQRRCKSSNGRIGLRFYYRSKSAVCGRDTVNRADEQLRLLA